mmetsp:Transcript_30117/g.76067  ORF Transcript_30117/g.76067 Transcript_30117/m.76067 type:complete len:110 (-) Transcript_30117:240-569(-)
MSVRSLPLVPLSLALASVVAAAVSHGAILDVAGIPVDSNEVLYEAAAAAAANAGSSPCSEESAAALAPAGFLCLVAGALGGYVSTPTTIVGPSPDVRAGAAPLLVLLAL